MAVILPGGGGAGGYGCCACTKKYRMLMVMVVKTFFIVTCFTANRDTTGCTIKAEQRNYCTSVRRNDALLKNKCR
jgi:hypothetical protein